MVVTRRKTTKGFGGRVSGRRLLALPERTVTEMLVTRETAAAAAYEARWTLPALRRVDPDLAQLLDEQRTLFFAALASGDLADIREHGEAMVRGWLKAIARMAAEPDNAYLVGVDPATGTRVAISTQRASEGRVREQHGDDILFLTPDEVAAIAATIHPAAAVKTLWPGATITQVRKKSPAEGAE